MKKMCFQFGLLNLQLLLLFLLWGGSTQAHGGGTLKLSNVDFGPYWLSVWVSPDPPLINNFHLTIAVAEPGDLNVATREAGPPVLNQTISVTLTPIDVTATTVSALATHENATNKFFYEADLVVPAKGRWQATIEMPEGTASAQFEVQVETPSWFEQYRSGIIALLLLLISGGIWWRRKYT
jgi:hypothetical protein